MRSAAGGTRSGAVPAIGQLFGMAALVGANLLWSGNMLAGRLLAADMSPLWSAFLRWVIGALFLTVLWLFAGRRPHISVRHLWLALSGMVLFNWLMFGALSLTSASQTALIYASNPALIGLFGIALTGERPSRLQWAGLILAIVGAAYLSFDFGGAHAMHLGLGAALMFGASLSWAFYTAYGRKALQGDMDVLSATTYASWLGLPFLAVAAFAAVPAGPRVISTGALLLLLYSGFLAAGVAFVWWNGGVAKLGLAVAGPFSNLLPVFTPLLAMVFLGERLTTQLLTGGAVVLLGAVLSSLPKSSVAGSLE